jgi:hypothetical protein
MDFDDVVIGSGLAALGAALGLGADRRVLVLGGSAQGAYAYYDARRTVPCSFLGFGGLGNDWHGVIPTGMNPHLGITSREDFAALFRYFYPNTEVRERLGTAGLFVPWRPIRPAREWRRLQEARKDRLVVLRLRAGGVEAVTDDASAFRCRRAWVAAGALHTPGLLARSFGAGLHRKLVSDHVLCYIGQVDGEAPPRITRSRDGMFIPATFSGSSEGLYTLRPARFGFRRLDHGIEQRAVFGLPTGSAIKKIVRRLSPGLLAEAFYNRFGVFAAADVYSVYGQTRASDAFGLGDDGALVERPAAIRIATDRVRQEQPFDRLQASRRPELHIPGIHLHHSVDLEELAREGLDSPESPVQVVDASVLTDIGPEHHSFKMLYLAHRRARNSLTRAGADG